MAYKIVFLSNLLMLLFRLRDLKRGHNLVSTLQAGLVRKTHDKHYWVQQMSDSRCKTHFGHTLCLGNASKKIIIKIKMHVNALRDMGHVGKSEE